jgi:transcriptional regulator
MYIQSHFEEHRIAVIHQLIRDCPVAALVTTRDGEVIIDHIPFFLNVDSSGESVLMGHMPRSNTVWKSFDGESKAVVVFQGPAAYITPNWYPSKNEHGKTVPTWNYVVVHAHGRPQAIHDAGWLFSHLNQLTDKQEANQSSPWRVSDAPPEYAQQMVRAIVGIEIPISSIVGKWKVSQNKSAADQAGVIEGLEFLGDDNSRAMAELISKHADDSK